MTEMETFSGIHWLPVNSPHKGQWLGALMFSLTYAWINGWVNNREASDLRRHWAHYDVTVMIYIDNITTQTDNQRQPRIAYFPPKVFMSWLRLP